MSAPITADAHDTSEARLRAFLADTLELWRVTAVVTAGAAPAVALIEADGGALVWIERPLTDDSPFRWLVRWRRAGDGPGGVRERSPRGCGSLVGVLSALRGALDVDRGTPLRVAPARLDR